jgi:hypothetical protein
MYPYPITIARLAPMQCSIKRRMIQLAAVCLHVLVVLSLLILAMGGRVPDSQGGLAHLSPPKR